MKGLSSRQREILEYMHERLVEDQVLPSYREIGDAMGIKSTNGVSDHVKALERKGYVSRRGGGGRGALARALTLTEQALLELGITANEPDPILTGDVVQIGVYGQVAAGQPVLAVENREETLFVDSCMVPGGGQVFALRVSGESMINAGILPGDYLFIRKQRTVRNGEIAVVVIDGDATVKTFFREGDRIRLQPENDTMEPIYVAASEFRDVQVMGVVCGVYRKMH
ncbi:MAG: transcriptional repressor LexA [Deltaproteobacteria bacterium]|nr:transcriptional repressor LexA [Deltaproteobacteria bacterium]